MTKPRRTYRTEEDRTVAASLVVSLGMVVTAVVVGWLWDVVVPMLKGLF